MKLSCVLIVDDSEGDQYLCKYLLEEEFSGVKVLQAYDGQEALEVLNKTDHSPNLIILDINMPRMNGIEFLDELRKDDDLKDAKVFILTVSNQDDDIYRAYKKNVAGYIVKSDPVESLKNALQLLNCGWVLVERRTP